MTDRVNRILRHESYRECLAKIHACEAGREFCRHEMGHFLDVARIAMILNTDEGYGVKEELIYAAALLHDIGRWQQYESGEDHALVSSRLAPAILADCGFTADEREAVTAAIGAHRDAQAAKRRDLSGLLYRADKLSRPCFACEKEQDCNWKNEKKNLSLIW